MYSLVLMMALGNGATPGLVPENSQGLAARYGNHAVSVQLNKKGCCGCSGCYGGCYGCYGCYGCHGCWGCYGCYSGWGCYGCGGCYGCCGGGVMPAMPGGEKRKGGDTGKSEESLDSTRPATATFTVTLPADAKLTIDGAPTKATSTTRVFVSPPLERGKDFMYTLEARIDRDGKPVTVTKDITVRAGQATQVRLEFAATSVAQK